MFKKFVVAVMVLSGALTLTMLLPNFPPAVAGAAMFEGAAEDGLLPVVLSNWRILIALSGGLLIAGALFGPLRAPALAFAGLSKIGFIALVFTRGFADSLGPAAAIDVVMVVLFAWFLFAGAKRG